MSNHLEKKVRELGLTVQFTFRTTKFPDWACRIFKEGSFRNEKAYYEGFADTMDEALTNAIQTWAKHRPRRK